MKAAPVVAVAGGGGHASSPTPAGGLAI